MAAVAIGSWILSRFFRRNLTFIWNGSMTLYTLFFCWLAISALASPYSDDNLAFVFHVYFPIYVVCILLVNSIEKEADLALIKQSLTLTLTGVIAVAMVLTFTNPKLYSGVMRLEGAGSTGNANDLAALAVLAIPFLLVSTIDRLKAKQIAWMNILCISILASGLFLSKSRAAAAALGGACLLYALLFSKSAKRILGWTLVTVPLLLLFMKAAMNRAQSDLEGSSESRWNYIVSGFRMFKTHPLMGVGVNNYPRFYEQYSQLFLETGNHTAHSTWMLLLAETGPIGFGLFTGLFFSIVGKAWKIRIRNPEFLMALLGYGITMSVLSHAYVLSLFIDFHDRKRVSGLTRRRYCGESHEYRGLASPKLNARYTGTRRTVCLQRIISSSERDGRRIGRKLGRRGIVVERPRQHDRAGIISSPDFRARTRRARRRIAAGLSSGNPA